MNESVHTAEMKDVTDELSLAVVTVAVIAPRDVPSEFEFEQVAITVGR